MPVIQPITSASSGSAYVPTSRILTINGVSYDLTADRSWTVEVLDNLIATAPLSYNSGTNTISISQSSNTTDGYLSSIDWLTFSSKQNSITLTTTGNSGAATLVGATLNIPEYTLAGLGGMANVFTTLGDLVYSNSAGAPVRRSPNITTTKMFLSQTGDGTSSAAPQWSVVTAADTGAVPTTRQLSINGTSYDLSADRSWSTITSLTGEATASGTGAVSVTLDNNSVIAKVLTGLNTSGGGNIVSTDTIVQAFGKVQNQITALVGGVMYEGTWNASTNSPTITSSVGNKGDYYVVSVAGSTTIDGISDWKVGDWIIFNGSTWQKVDNTDLVSSVNGYTGAVVLTTSDVAEGTNLYFTNTRAQNALTLTTTGSSGASTYTSGTLNIPNYSLSGLGGVPTTRQLTINGTAYDLSADRTWSVGTVTSVALTMPSAFSVANSPVTSSGTLAVTAIGNATQYIRGDGALATLPTSGTGGGASVSYYLNGSVNQGTIGGVTYYEMNETPIIGGGTDFTRSSNGYIASFLTDANDPALLSIPAGNWNFETYFEASSSGGTPSFYLELYKYDGTTFTLIASNSGTPKIINDGTSVEAYFSALAVPQTTLTLTDRLAIRIYVTTAGRTITLHTENSNLCQVITTFTTGLTAINNLTAQVQFFATGTSGSDFNISSVTDTHTFNLPTASGSVRGALSSTDWTTFNSKQNALNGTGFVKISGTTISYDNSTYYLATNPSNYITLTSLSAGTGISYNNTTGVISSTITQYTDALARASISETITGIDYNNTTGVFSTTSGYGIPTTASQTNWDSAYNNMIVSAAVTGTTTKTLTLTQQDAGTITASWTDDNTDAVTSVFGRTGAVVATSGDYTTAQVTESGNLYYTDTRARASISLTTTGSSGSSTYNSTTGVLNVPTYTAAGLGAVPTSRTITINDVAFDLSANRSWSVGDFGTW
jgi:hypothetical protein